MCNAGIDMTKFCPHSTRSASAAYSKFIQIDEIMHLAGWKSADSFFKYYCIELPIEHLEPPTRFLMHQKQKAQKKTINSFFSKDAKIKEVQAAKSHKIHSKNKPVNTATIMSKKPFLRAAPLTVASLKKIDKSIEANLEATTSAYGDSVRPTLSEIDDQVSAVNFH